MRLLLPLYVTAQLFLMDRVEAARRRREDGQGATEYIGMLVLVAVALVIVLGMSDQFTDIGEKFKTAIDNIASAIGGMSV